MHQLFTICISFISHKLFTIFEMSLWLRPVDPTFVHILNWLAKSITTIVMSSTRLLFYLPGLTCPRNSLVMPRFWAAIDKPLFSNCAASVLALS